MAVPNYEECSVTFKTGMCAPEGRAPGLGPGLRPRLCCLSSSYGFMSGAWPFGVVEGARIFIAPRR
jgi:hypothetical protein